MKARTETKNGYIYFAYEDYYGTQFGSWSDAEKNGEGALYLVGYFRSYYYGCCERIDEMFLIGKPRVCDIKKFITDCITFITED